MSPPRSRPLDGGPKSPGLGRHFKPSDLRAVAQLATQATLGLMDATEGVHQSVLRTLGGASNRGPGRTAGVTGLVYRSVRGITTLVGQGLDLTLQAVVPKLFAQGSPDSPETPERAQALAVLNGVLGDRLAASNSPLALAMGFRVGGHSWQPGLPWPHAAGDHPKAHVLLTVHGLCMNDAQWLWHGHDHGAWLAQHLDCTRLNLRYNTGQHISDNGTQLAQLLEQLVTQWPVPLTRLTIVGHSMGGLVARSAHAAGELAGHTWPQHLKELVFLGSPHHGSPLERAGHWVDMLLSATPFTAPLAPLGKVRSVGITDLRHGHVRPQDWQALARQPRSLGRHIDTRVPLPLPAGVRCFAVAATLAGRRSLLAERLTGDGLVPLNSALGVHDDPRRKLAFALDHQLVVHGMGHLDLLGSLVVARRLAQWLGADAVPGP